MARTTEKPRVLVIKTGGTIGQERGSDGIFRPSSKEYLNKVKGIYDLANINVQSPANIDSTNMETSHRAMLADLIYKNHRDYEGFVIVHGTDTMADTGAALTYMIQDLGAPVVLTGSQKSIFVPGSDGPSNLYYAVKAATLDLGEIVIAFGDKIVRANRATKISEQGLNAFDSPRVRPVGEIGVDIILSDERIRRYNGDPRLFTAFDTNIEVYHQSSGTNTRMFEKYIEDAEVHGIVVGGFGAGNVQERLVPYIRRATESGKPVLVVTNCLLGAADMGIYEVGSAPLQAGAVSAGDLTMEAAIQKLMFAVGRANQDAVHGTDRISYVRNLIHRSYAKDMAVTGNRF